MEANTTNVVPTQAPTQAWVLTEKFLAIVAKHGLMIETQSGFHKVLGPKGNQLYVANTKSCRRIDISGFDAGPVLAGPPKGPNGNVTGMMRMEGLSETEQLERFEKLILTLKEQPAKVPAPKPPKAPKAPKAEGSTSTAAAPSAEPASRTDVINARLKDIERIRNFAEKAGQALSPKVQAEFESLSAEFASLTAPMAPAESVEITVEA